MHFQSPSPNTQGAKFQRSNTFPEDFNNYLLQQATQFVQKNALNILPQQQTPPLATVQRQYIKQNLNIQPFHSDQSLITANRQYNHQTFNTVSEDLDLYLTKQAEDLVQRTLRTHSEGTNMQYILPTVQYALPIQQNQEDIQIPHYIVQPAQPIQYYVPHPQVQEREPIYHFIEEQPIQIPAPMPQIQPNQLILPSPVIRREQINVRQAAQDQTAMTNVEATDREEDGVHEEGTKRRSTLQSLRGRRKLLREKRTHSRSSE